MAPPTPPPPEPLVDPPLPVAPEVLTAPPVPVWLVPVELPPPAPVAPLPLVAEAAPVVAPSAAPSEPEQAQATVATKNGTARGKLAAR
ncbi:MAG TPA: hypothetical protein VF989_06100 [Polyangiaceae bacterium]